MTEKEKILNRVRIALRAPAPRPGAHGDASPAHEPDPSDIRQWLPPRGHSVEQRLGLFQKNAQDLKAEFHLCESIAEIGLALGEMAARDGWKRVATHSGALTDPVIAGLHLPVCRTDTRYEVRDLEACDAGITQCDALVAQTGSILVTNRTAGGRALSVLPPHHIVLAQRSQMVGDLSDAFELLAQKYGGNYPSFISFITGPSRTGDIERVLVLGAHGPKKLTIYCI